MPELPEVERAVRLIRSVALGKRIIKVETLPDAIVFSGISNPEFETEIAGRVVKGVHRYGKVFYLELDGTGRFPVLHFGMTGMLQVRGQLATYYKDTPRKASTEWPPKYMKFNFHIETQDSGCFTELAFLDARRLGRIRLCASPLAESPISNLGFDPILSLPSVEEFKQTVKRRACPIKALLLDQSFSAGVGNWVADEILYHARVHPEQRCKTLSDEQLDLLHRQIVYVCQTAVDANADSSKFPENWLFNHRWGKGKKKIQDGLKLPTGEPATIKWLTVGGRTSAYVTELQHLNEHLPQHMPSQEEDHKRESEGDSHLSSLSETGVESEIVEIEQSVDGGRKRTKKENSKYALESKRQKVTK